MRKTKFWLVQLVMVAILGLVFGSPIFADKPAHIPSPEGDGKPSFVGSQPDFSGQQDFAGQGKPVHANANSVKDGGTDATCSVDTPDLCTTSDECLGGGGLAWYQGVCYF